ncbi:MAG: polyprenol phosphomannose-dependent alpha 1,6 mannosyltransferase MptB [Solirubrobacteraceae bacterium]
MQSLPRSRSIWGWAALGLAGSLLIALAGPRSVADPVTAWWYMPPVPGGRTGATVLVYAGIAVLCLAWLGLGRRTAEAGIRGLILIAGAWLLPIALGPTLFSHDAYSYLAQGTVLHLGENPYRTAPAVLASLGHAHVLAAVSPFWRHVTAPYGPLFLGLMSVIVAVTGSHLVAGILAVRALELVGVVLIARYLPRLAQALGADPARATWLVLLSPLLLLELIAAGHNDVLMAGLLLAGVTVAVQGRPLNGIALCALAATVKLPALAGALFIAVAWAREEPTAAATARFALKAVLIVAAVLGAVSLVTGLGLSWVSGSLFSSPARVRLAITPSTGIGFTIASLLHDAGLAVDSRSLEALLTGVSTGLAGVLGLWLLYRVRIPKLALYLGALLLVAAVGGPAAWPWYLSWGLVLLGACAGPQRSAALVLATVISVFLIKPNGILALPLPSAPAVMAIYLALAGLFWYSRRGGRGSGDRGAAGGLETPRARSARRAALTLARAGQDPQVVRAG